MSIRTFAKPSSPPRATYLSFGAERLSALWRGVMQRECPKQILDLFASILDPWGRRPMPRRPLWLSDVGDDHSPFEFSLAVGGLEPELRILLEAQGDAPTPAAYWDAGCALNERLAREFGADLDRLRQVEDLFRPTDAGTNFAMWHSVCLFEKSKPAWKIYLNPQARGKGSTAAVVEEALVRLGYPRAWPILSQIAGQRGPDADEIKYFSLDLAKGEAARLKIYFRHHRATAADLERAFSAAKNHVPGDVEEFCRDLVDSEGPFLAKPIGSCFSFVGGDDERPSKATLHLPVARYAANDSIVAERVSAYLEKHDIPAKSYEEPIRAFANRALEDGVGMHSYASLRREKTGRRITLYLSPEAFQVEPPLQSIRMRRRVREELPAEEIVERYEGNSMADHPFFRRLGREPVDVQRLWLMLANARVGIVQDFSRRLASVTGRIDDERLRCLLAKQLNDELGDGDPTRAHRLLFEQLLAKVESFRPAGVNEETFAPGRELSRRLEAIYSDPDPYVGIGAAMVIEIYGKQVDLCVGKELRRQKQLDPESLGWLTLHEELELDHASESMDMARLLPDSGPKLEAAWRGAEAICAASWAFFDAMYRLCFG